MLARKDSTSHMGNVLATIFKRTKAYGFRMILLTPDISQDQTARIRHYDIECEGAELMTHILKTSI